MMGLTVTLMKETQMTRMCSCRVKERIYSFKFKINHLQSQTSKVKGLSPTKITRLVKIERTVMNSTTIMRSSPHQTLIIITSMAIRMSLKI